MGEKTDFEVRATVVSSCYLLWLCFFFPETISSIPLQLEEDDIEDFCSLAQYYASRTPQSFRKVGAKAVFFDVAFFF